MKPRRGKGPPVRAEINVTSLVDVAFTLLVIFIITAPVLQGGVELDLPQGPVRTVEVTDDLFIVNVLADNTVVIGDDTRIGSGEEVEATLRQLIRASGVAQVFLKADSAAMYGRVFRVLSAISREEGARMTLIGEEAPR